MQNLYSVRMHGIGIYEFHAGSDSAAKKIAQERYETYSDLVRYTTVGEYLRTSKVTVSLGASHA
jgi:hypothetical protein